MVTISEAELKVMQVIWDKKATTSLEIIKFVKDSNWNDNTVRTLINRLIAKKAVGISEKNGKTYTYVPLIEKEKYVTYTTKNFLKKIFNGSAFECLSLLIENMSKEECNEIYTTIKCLLENK